MRKKIFLQIIFIEPSVGGGFLFSVYSVSMINAVPEDYVFCFRPASPSAHPPLMPVYYVGIGCSLSAAKVVPGFHGQKRSGRQAV